MVKHPSSLPFGCDISLGGAHGGDLLDGSILPGFPPFLISFPLQLTSVPWDRLLNSLLTVSPVSRAAAQRAQTKSLCLLSCQMGTVTTPSKLR